LNKEIWNIWHYYKLYLGPKTSDDFLITTVRELTDYLIYNKIITHWFFIRYIDPSPHLRVRFRLSHKNQNKKFTEKINSALSPWLNNTGIWRIQTEKYQRELSRYGQDNIENSEIIFWHDSNAAIDFIKLLKNDQDEEKRWLFSLCLINAYLDVFTFNSENKCNLLTQLRKAYYDEFGIDHFVKSQIDKKYRKHRKKIESIIIANEPEYHELYFIINRLKKNILSVSKIILEKHRKGNLEIALEELVCSYVHMSINRLFRTRQRLHELVIYDFACRYFHSFLAREKQNI